MAERSVIVIDEDINKRVAVELKSRGRRAFAVSELGLKGSSDPALLPALRDHDDLANHPWVLVSGDDAMPHDHSELLAQLGVTLATIDPRQPDELLQDSWRRDVVHRWAHAMQEQEAGSIRRYSAHRNAAWKPRRR